MTVGPVLRSYLAGCDPVAAPVLTALDAAVTAAHPGFDVAVKYHLVMYAMPGDWRHWVCAVNATKHAACLRFLYGVLLDDPLGVLRPGTATLMTWDLPFDADVDPDAVGGYVRQAVDRYEHFRANAKEINAASKVAAQERGRRRTAR